MSVARDADPIFMGSANDVAVRDENYDDGYTNKCLDISEFSVAATNRELVNLENAAVNIDNSSDVIIGPVTQFNVNGNVTIYQNKDGLPIGIEQNDDDIIPNCNGNVKENRIEQKLKAFIKYLKDNYPKRKKDIGRICICVLLSSCAMVLFVSISTRTNELTDVPIYDRHLGNYNVYTINDWGRKMVTHILDNPLPVGLVIVSHTSTETCESFQKCAEMLRVLQIYQTTTLGYEDICYNFFIGITGDIYVGRGWDTRNCYTNILSIAISFIGNFNRAQATKEMRESLVLLLQQGVELSKLPDNYLLVGYNQTELSNSPGENVYGFIKDLPNFSDIDLRQKYKNQCSIYEVRVGHDGLWSYPTKL